MLEIKPNLIVAMPQLADPNFAKSVVLLLHYDQTGAFGFVINNPSKVDLGIFSRAQNLECHPQIEKTRVLTGGPVETARGWMIHSNESISEKQEISPGVFISGSSQTLESLLNQGDKSLRLVLGYSGWADHQLEQEMKQGTWVSAPFDKKYMWDIDADNLWDTVLKDLGVDPSKLTVSSGVH